MDGDEPDDIGHVYAVIEQHLIHAA